MGSAIPLALTAVTSQSEDFNVLARWDIYEIIFGTFLSVIGLVLIALSLLRWKMIDLSMVSFGILCFLYGARTKAFQFLFDIPHLLWTYTFWFITYLIPIPAWLFAEQFLGKGWKSSIRRLLQFQIVFSIAAISLSTYQGNPSAAIGASNIMAIIGIAVVMANLFQPHLSRNRELNMLRVGFLIFALLALHANIAPWLTKGYASFDFEWLGFLIFIGCLGYAVARRFFQNEKDLITIAHELETARQIQSFILPGESVNIDGLRMAARYVPVASVAGDFYDFTKVDEKRLGILVADVSGHGVPASLISSMVKIAFASNIPHAANPAKVLDGINQVLCGKLENDFVTAGYVFLDIEEKNMIYAGAGHMPLLLWRAAEKKIYEFREKGTILGQFEDIQLKNIGFALKPDDRILLYTDGIIETGNPNQTLFGLERLKEFIISHAQLPADQFADALIRKLFKWSGKPSEEALDDDLTLIVADYQRGS
jgi:serine phosphatase RsbU (regulator of sigma subunit)